MKLVIKTIIVLCFIMTLTGCQIPNNNQSNSKVETVSVTDLKYEFDTTHGKQSGVYSGETINNIPNGYGTLTFSPTKDIKTVYEGNFKNGKLNGKGKLTGYNYILDINNCVLEGEFSDTINFDGILYFNNTKIYEGSLAITNSNLNVDDYFGVPSYCFNGRGNLFDLDGEIIYSGDFLDAKPIDIQNFKDVCKNYSAKDIQKYCNSNSNSLIKHKLSRIYLVDCPCFYNWVVIYDGEELEEYSNSANFFYKYDSNDVKLVEKESITAYGILLGTDSNSMPIIWTLLVE